MTNPTHLAERKDDGRYIRAVSRFSAHHILRIEAHPLACAPCPVYDEASYVRPSIVTCRSHKELHEAFEDYKHNALSRAAGRAVIVCYEVAKFDSDYHANLNGGSERFNDADFPVTHIRHEEE